MLETQTEKVGNASMKMHVLWNGASVTVGSALDLCRTNDVFRSALIGTLALRHGRRS
jgi:hypothetical protein